MKRLFLKFRKWYVRRKLWKAAHILILCGQNNGEYQAVIDEAKDAIYRAICIIDH